VATSFTLEPEGSPESFSSLHNEMGPGGGATLLRAQKKFLVTRRHSRLGCAVKYALLLVLDPLL
jgi:hypothetical protein